MNGQPLPHFNGFPARIIVPGWTGTYWMKHVIAINALTKPQGGFWMNPAYRVPVGKFPLGDRFITQEYAPNTPITEIVVNSLITSHRDGDKVKAGKVTVSGMAWDGGYGIRTVQVSTDGGKTWGTATLGQDLGRFAFRPWSFELCTPRSGKNSVMVNAINKLGQSQTVRVDLQPGRLSQQRHAKHHADGVTGGTMQKFVIALVAALIASPALADEQVIKLKQGARPRQGRGQLRGLPHASPISR